VEGDVKGAHYGARGGCALNGEVVDVGSHKAEASIAARTLRIKIVDGLEAGGADKGAVGDEDSRGTAGEGACKSLSRRRPEVVRAVESGQDCHVPQLGVGVVFGIGHGGKEVPFGEADGSVVTHIDLLREID